MSGFFLSHVDLYTGALISTHSGDRFSLGPLWSYAVALTRDYFGSGGGQIHHASYSTLNVAPQGAYAAEDASRALPVFTPTNEVQLTLRSPITPRSLTHDITSDWPTWVEHIHHAMYFILLYRQVHPPRNAPPPM